MNQLKQQLALQYQTHPEMEIRDAVKFLYQACMGPGHLITDEEQALSRLSAEWDRTPSSDAIPLFSPLGTHMGRLNLSACKAKGLSINTVCRLFCLTAQKTVSNPTALDHSLDLVYSLPFPVSEVDDYLRRYREEGCPAVSHSPRYRSCYAPAYRVISSNYASYLPVLIAIDRRMKDGLPIRIALDGPCASGKSTAAQVLSQIYGAPVLHMDDFFLRPEQRTPERLSQPGGNVDYERFYEEVLSPLVSGHTCTYRPWRCSMGQFGPTSEISPGPLTIIEGSYSLRPELRPHYHLRVWVEAPWEVRRQRLLEREGIDGLHRFESMWIPMENHYFKTFDVSACCSIHLNSTSPAFSSL